MADTNTNQPSPSAPVVPPPPFSDAYGPIYLPVYVGGTGIGLAAPIPVPYVTNWSLNSLASKYSVPHTLAGNETISFDADGVIGGGYQVTIFSGDKSASVVFPPGTKVAGEFDPTRENFVYAEKIPNGVIVVIQAFDLPEGPSVASAVVANATPGRIDLTWSGPVSSTISAAAAFTVANHTVSAHTYADATHTYLTVDPFGADESASFTYAVPASNKMQGTDGLVSGPFSRAITNGVVAEAGVLIVSSITPPNRQINLTTEGTRGWAARVYEQPLHKQGYDVVETTANAPGNYYESGYSGNGPTGYTFNDNAPGPNYGANAPTTLATKFAFADAPSGQQIALTIPVNAVQQTIDFHFICFGGGTVATLATSLSDSSADAVTRNITGSGQGQQDARSARIIVKAGSANQTLTMTLTVPNGGGLEGYMLVAV